MRIASSTVSSAGFSWLSREAFLLLFGQGLEGDDARTLVAVVDQDAVAAQCFVGGVDHGHAHAAQAVGRLHADGPAAALADLLRDLGGDVEGLIRAIKVGMAEGPHIVRAGRMLTQTGGHGDAEGGPRNPCNGRR